MKEYSMRLPIDEKTKYKINQWLYQSKFPMNEAMRTFLVQLMKGRVVMTELHAEHRDLRHKIHYQKNKTINLF